jgi:hypothetical protein
MTRSSSCGLPVKFAGEIHRLAELDVILDGQRYGREDEREGRHAEEPAEGLPVPERRRLLLRADHRDRHDRRSGLEREAQEAEAELLEDVALREALVHPTDALGKGDDRLLVLEEIDAVLRCPDHAPGAHHEDVEERQPRQPVLAHPAHDPRRIGLEEGGRADHRGIERDLPGVVADQEHPAGQQVLGAAGLDAEVVAVDQRREDHPAPHGVGLQAPRIVPVGVQVHGCAGQLLGDLFLDAMDELRREGVEAQDRVADGVARAVQERGLRRIVGRPRRPGVARKGNALGDQPA